MADDNRSGIDKLFDIAESVLEPMEAALKPAEVPQQHPIINVDSSAIRHHDWEAQFTGWAVAHEGRSESWHAFPLSGSHLTTALCGKEFSAAQIRTIPGELPKGKTIFCCTTCIVELLHG